METPQAFVIAPPAIAHDVRDILAQAGLLLYALDYREEGAVYKVLAVRKNATETKRLLSTYAHAERLEVQTELSSDQLGRLSLGERLMVETSLRRETTEAKRPAHKGTSWDALGFAAPRKLDNQR